MKRVHLIAVEGPPERYADLVATAAAEGHRVGWLELQESQPLPQGFEEVLDSGVFRVVSLGAASTAVATRRRGPWVLRDVVRSHFRGTLAVLVRGEHPDLDLPRLAPAEGGWRIHAPDGRVAVLASGALVARLRRPLPFGSPRS